MVGLRLTDTMLGHLERLIAELPEPAYGPITRSGLIRSCLGLGMKILAEEHGIELPGLSAPKPAKANGTAVPRSNPKVKPSSQKRAQERAAIRAAAGCTCAHSHVRSCKLYRSSNSASA